MSAPDVAPYFDLPPGNDLARRNRLLIADRTGWPPGVVSECERIEYVYPDWAVSWRHENTIKGFERPAGFYADRRTGRRHLERPLYGAVGKVLEAQIKAWRPDPDRWPRPLDE
ncbi:MAG: hypothetical protein JWO11_4448 [Nocardioides sp.]|nr:hypothetical protein [Nocardioides sp.]